MLNNDNAETRKVLDVCYKKHKTTVNPIVDWSDENVWDFIKAETIPYCKLYDEGCTRLGCIGCPLAVRKKREWELTRWPTYRHAYLLTFERLLKERDRRGKLDGTWRMWTRAIDVFNWWMEYDVLPDQINLFEEEEDDD